MQNRAIISALALLAIGTAVACGPSLAVRHQDPAQPAVVVYVDNEAVGTVERGEELEVRVDRGMHTVEAIPAGSDVNPWAEDGRGWRVFVDEGTIITLFGANGPPAQEDALMGAAFSQTTTTDDAADDVE